jgi:4-carboxymuconolactone decarboxylase
MKGRTGGGGPYGILTYAPMMAEHFSAVENYFRHHGMLDTKDKELVILACARELGARFPWSRHEIRGREAGVRTEAIEALRAHGSLDALTERERLVVDIARSLLGERRLSNDLFSRALAELGPERLVEMVGLVSHYNMISSVANVFDLEAPGGATTF